MTAPRGAAVPRRNHCRFPVPTRCPDHDGRGGTGSDGDSGLGVLDATAVPARQPASPRPTRPRCSRPSRQALARPRSRPVRVGPPPRNPPRSPGRRAPAPHR
ncbi:hypothetical protein NKG94_50055 [Micromonospora sp. M12]